MFKFTKLLTLLLLLDVSCAFALDTPTEDFIDNKDGTVTYRNNPTQLQCYCFLKVGGVVNFISVMNKLVVL